MYQGRPGGVLVWDPTIVRHTTVTRDELTDDAPSRRRGQEAVRRQGRSASRSWAGSRRAPRTRRAPPRRRTSTTVDHPPGGDLPPRERDQRPPPHRGAQPRGARARHRRVGLRAPRPLRGARSSRPASGASSPRSSASSSSRTSRSASGLRGPTPRCSRSSRCCSASASSCITRLDLAVRARRKRVAPTQAVWTAVGVAAFVLTL